MSRLPKESEAGFTLIELLITVTLLSFLTLLLFGGLRFGARAWDGAQAHGVRTDELRVVQNLLRREIEAAYPAYDAADPIHPRVDFRGEGNRMTFLARAPQAASSSGRSRITISQERAGDGAQLAIHGVPELATTRDKAWSSALLRHVAAVRFSYFAGNQWRSSWTDAKALPDLIRIQIVFPSGDGRIWPDLIVAPQIATDANCIYDVAAQRCQGRS